jgi:hypothetical protein
MANIKSESTAKKLHGGGGEIRTHASDETPIGFQDRPLKPLGYASMINSKWWTL